MVFKWNLTNGEVGLFDMKNDVNNDHNLAEDQQELVEQFKQKILDWKEAI